MPEIRGQAAAIFAIHGAVVLASGLTADWVANVVAHGAPLGNYGPSAQIGVILWLVIGIPLGVFLALRGRVGWAGLAVSPYWLAGYLMMPLVELRHPARRNPVVERGSRPPPSTGAD
ncbi:MAG: hypothetical protein ACR2I5_03795 [Candidatus Limnocylindria bacterium]